MRAGVFAVALGLKLRDLKCRAWGVRVWGSFLSGGLGCSQPQNPTPGVLLEMLRIQNVKRVLWG